MLGGVVHSFFGLIACLSFVVIIAAGVMAAGSAFLEVQEQQRSLVGPIAVPLS